MHFSVVQTLECWLNLTNTMLSNIIHTHWDLFMLSRNKVNRTNGVRGLWRGFNVSSILMWFLDMLTVWQINNYAFSTCALSSYMFNKEFYLVIRNQIFVIKRRCDVY